MDNLNKDNNLSNIIKLAESFGRDLVRNEFQNLEDLKGVLGVFLTIKKVPQLETLVLENSDYLNDLWPCINDIISFLIKEELLDKDGWQ